MSIRYFQIVSQKMDIAKKLNNGLIGGSYYEAILIASSIISNTAQLLWPGDKIDRKRFVELLIHYSDGKNVFSHISIPLLFESKILTKEQEKIIFNEYRQKSFALVLTGKEIDVPEHYITTQFPDINLKELRKYSYADIFYKYFRTPIVHEYGLAKYAAAYPQTTQDSFVSYINNVNFPYRRINFNFDRIAKVVEFIALEVSSIIRTIPLQLPEKWWVDGMINKY